MTEFHSVSLFTPSLFHQVDLDTSCDAAIDSAERTQAEPTVRPNTDPLPPVRSGDSPYRMTARAQYARTSLKTVPAGAASHTDSGQSSELQVGVCDLHGAGVEPEVVTVTPEPFSSTTPSKQDDRAPLVSLQMSMQPDLCSAETLAASEPVGRIAI